MKEILSEIGFIDESTEMIESRLGKYGYVLKGCRLENTQMDDYSYCGEYCIMQNASMGKFVNVAAMVRIGATQHPIERASLHHFTYRRKMYGFDSEDDIEFFEKRRDKKVIIGHDVWIGHGAVIMPGVTIGNGAVIGSGSVVTKDVEKYSIVAGVPAKKIRYRFSQDIIDKFEEINWWDWSHEKIKENFNDFLLSGDEFIKKHYESR
jgi:phosphonate metabolism protein (transferase hexapeptide repeat family)